MENPELDAYRPVVWLRSGHAQTVGARLLRRLRHGDGDGRFRRERLETPDGDFLDLDWYRGGPSAGPLVLVLHGLEGCSRSGYVLEACRALASEGLRSVALNFRSCSGEPNRLPRSYHAGATDDLALVLDHLARRRAEARPCGALGFSLGGNLLAKYLGEGDPPAQDGIAAAAAISVPFDLGLAAERMEGPAGRLYARFFLASLRRGLRRKAALCGRRIDVRRGLRARTIREFDERVTAPLHGFHGAAHYYAVCSSGSSLPAIRTPTLFLHARDDPVAPLAGAVTDAVAGNPALTAVFTDRGGHVGFVADGPAGPHLWGEKQAARFLAARLSTPSDRAL